MINKTAIIILSCSDYESLEISLANYAKNLKENHKLFILQNGRNTYDSERTYRVALRYQILYPDNITVVDWIKPQNPYNSIKELINSDKLKDFDYICKVDDDVFPLHENWLEKLAECYKKSKEKYDNKLAYVTSLVNNNFWGFNEVLNIFNLKQEFFDSIARDHYVGDDIDPVEKRMKISKNEIYTGWSGTVHRNPYISRWLHTKTTLFPEEYLKLTKNLNYKEVDSKKRYAINCMFFEKNFWNSIQSTNCDFDEYMVLQYCRKNDLKIIADLSNPFVHLFYWVQREENRDLIPVIRKTYEEFLKLPFPISICPNKDYEIENRLRELDKDVKILKNSKNSAQLEEDFLNTISNVLNSNKKLVLWGASNFLKKLTLKYPLNDENILGIIDSNSEKQSLKFGSYKIYSPNDLLRLKPDVIVVSIINNKLKCVEDIEQILKEQKIKNIKIV